MEKILPPLTALSQPYFDGCRAGELRLQQCTRCNEFQFYPRVICSHCCHDELQWQVASGSGEIASFTVVRTALSKAYETPYVLALITLEEGPSMMSIVIDAAPEDVAIGMSVQADYLAWSEEISMPVFRLTSNGGTS